MKSALASVALLLLAAAPAPAAVKAGGYLKNFWQYSKASLDGRPYYLNTSRGRLILDAEKSAFKAHVSYDHQVAAGSFFRTRDFAVFGYSPPKPWLDMEGTISTGTTNGYGHGAYRAWVGVENERGVVRAGRQRIAWGTGKMWNPTDILNPFNPVSIEQTERRGVDALYGRLGVGALGQAELAWAPGEVWVDHALVARGRGNIVEGWDASVLGGKVAGSTGSLIVGGDFAGTVLEGTFHGELAWFRPEWRTPYWKAGLGYDYNFGDGSALVVEAYHAGNGETDPARYNFVPVRAGKELGAARSYAGGTYSRDIHTLLKLETAGVVNADDRSTYFMPALTWNALDDLYLSAAWQRFGGERRSEFGRQANQTILTAQYYF